MLSLAPGWVSRRHAIKMISAREPRVRLGEPSSRSGDLARVAGTV